MSGRQPSPRKRINPEFVAAILVSPISNCQLALRAGFPHPSNFSSYLHAQLVPASEQMNARLRIVAILVDFHGEIFLEEHPAIRAKEAFDTNSLPAPMGAAR